VTAEPAGPAGQSGAPTGRTGRRTLVILLILSVALNVFFVAGAAWIRLHPPPRWGDLEHRYQRMEAELDLEPQQRTGFDAYVAAMRTRTQKMRQQAGPAMNKAWEEIAKPQADAAQVMRLLDEAAEARRDFQRETTARTLEFLATLTPAQRSKFVAIARERPGSRQH
jgi:uncharacterized membrane protein